MSIKKIYAVVGTVTNNIYFVSLNKDICKAKIGDVPNLRIREIVLNVGD